MRLYKCVSGNNKSIEVHSVPGGFNICYVEYRDRGKIIWAKHGLTLIEAMAEVEAKVTYLNTFDGTKWKRVLRVGGERYNENVGVALPGTVVPPVLDRRLGHAE